MGCLYLGLLLFDLLLLLAEFLRGRGLFLCRFRRSLSRRRSLSLGFQQLVRGFPINRCFVLVADR